jgi:hypothetical protein
MRLLLGTILLTALAGVAAADTDCTVTWDAGEMSKDMSVWHTTLTVTGDKVHYESQYSGRNAGQPDTKPRKGDLTVKDSTKLAAALAALDAMPVTKPSPSRSSAEHRETGCVKHGAKARCGSHIGKDALNADFKAVSDVRDAIVDSTMTPGG